MLKYLSNAFVILFITINQLLIAQVEQLKNSGAFDQACQKGIGPWYFAATYANYDGAVQYDIIDLKSKKISLIDRDGIICFCEGESKFSGLVTANNVTLYGNGTVERVIVSPSIDNYFNLVFLKDDDLVLFDQYYPFILKDDELSISNGKENLELSIKNITFTNSLTRNESENWLLKYTDRLEKITEQLVTNLNCISTTLRYNLEFDNENERAVCFDDDQTFDPELSKSSIQGNRPSTTLALENVIFKEIDNDNLLEFYSEEGIATLDNVQLIQNKTSVGMLIDEISNLKLSNVKADRNINTNFVFTKNQNVSLSDVTIENSKHLSALLMFGNFNQSLSKIKVYQNELYGLFVFSDKTEGPTLAGEGKLAINDFEVSDSQIFSIWFVNQKLKAENISFNDNKWYAPFMFMSSEQNPFKFSGLEFENNRPGVEVDFLIAGEPLGVSFFTIGISGFGSFNNFTFRNSKINLPIIITSSKTIFDGSLFEENTINGMNETFNPFIIQVGNIEYINTQFLKNNFQWRTHSTNTQGQEIVIFPRFIFVEGNEPALAAIGDRQDYESLYRSLENHNISMRNVRMNHSENVASIFTINANELRDMPLPRDAENLPSFFQQGVENGDFNIYKLKEVDRIECGFEERYNCER